MKLKAIIILTLCAVLSGCGYELKETPQTSGNTTAAANAQNSANNRNDSANSNSAKQPNPASTENKIEEGTLALTGTGENAVHPCKGREVEIDAEATANTYTLTGECKKITVEGVSNKIFVEKVGEVVVSGISNKITYGEGIGGKKPKITKSGTHTDVFQKGSAEEKKATESKQ